jgi:hypothetical protein
LDEHGSAAEMRLLRLRDTFRRENSSEKTRGKRIVVIALGASLCLVLLVCLFIPSSIR